jgi:group I intron endonuclease
MHSGGIYQIRCLVNQRVYIGSAKSFSKRFGDHLDHLLKGTHVNPHLQHSFTKYGEHNFSFEVIEILGDYDKIKYFERENFYIDEARKTGNCYNIAKAEGGWTYNTAERKAEILAKISKSLRIYYDNLSAEERSAKYGSYRKGKACPDNEKEKISATMKGVLKTEATKEKMKAFQQSRSMEDKQAAGRRVGQLNKGKNPPNTRKVQVDDKIFESLKEAANFLNAASSTICNSLKYRNGVYKHHKVMYL